MRRLHQQDLLSLVGLEHRLHHLRHLHRTDQSDLWDLSNLVVPADLLDLWDRRDLLHQSLRPLRLHLRGQSRHRRHLRLQGRSDLRDLEHRLHQRDL